MKNNDKAILRELAEKYMEKANDPIQEERRKIWRHLNSLQMIRPAIYIRAFAWREMPQSQCFCNDPFLRGIEDKLRTEIFRSSFGDDYIIEPWLTMKAASNCSGWGITGTRNFTEEQEVMGAYKEDYPIKELSDIKKLKVPSHSINEEETAQKFETLGSMVGDIIKIKVDRGPVYLNFAGDISTELGHLRGIENIMMDMMDNPGWLHELLSFMRDGILKVHEEAEKAGDWGLVNHYNQAMPYSLELEDPEPSTQNVARKKLWCFMASQEYTCISPEMFNEFLLQYQIPIIEKFGLSAYGCCEDLTAKIPFLKKIPNLRRIALTPFMNIERSVESIGRDYVISYRPSPADMVSYDFDRDRIMGILKKGLSLCKGSQFDITLKDVETVERDPERIRKWVAIVREALDEL